MLIDSIDNHLAEAAEIDKAAIPLGMFVAWCANLGLLSEAVMREHERMVLRVRMHDARGSELLAALGGALEDEHLNARGREFALRYYPSFMDDFAAVFGGAVYEIKDDWDNYGKIAPILTAKLLGRARGRERGRVRGRGQVGNGLVGKLRQSLRKLWH